MTTDLPQSNKPAQQPSDGRCAELEAELASLRKQVARLKRFEQEHAWQTAFIQQFIDLIPLGIAVNTNGVVTYINSMGRLILKGESDEEILGKPAIGFVHPDDRELAARRIAELRETEPGKPFSIAPFVEERFLRLDGEVVDVETAALPLRMADAEFSLLVLFRDVTEGKRQRRLLQEREARFRQLVSLLPVATIIHKQGVVSFANQTALDLLRLESEEDIVGHTVFEFIHPGELELVKKRIHRVMETRRPLPMIKERIRRADGDIFLAETTAFPFVENGEEAVLVVLHDVTEQERMLEALEKSESRFRMLAELLPASVFMANENGELVYINVASKTILGFTFEEAMQIDFRERIEPELLARVWQKIRATPIGESVNFEVKIKDKVGRWRWLDIHLLRTFMDGDLVELGVATDVTWRKEVETLLKQQAQKLVSAYEEERSRIARELHDEIGQQLIGMKFVLDRARHFVNSEQGQAALMDAGQILENLTEMVRELSLSFRPTQLDDLGLLPTLVWHFERYTNRTGIKVKFSHLGLDGRDISKAVEITVYRIIQEALTNVARHAEADTVNVSIHVDQEVIYLAIIDNGVGFDSEAVMGSYVSSGLSGMQERVQLLGGDLRIESSPGQGVSIQAAIPVRSVWSETLNP